ncbi:subtilase-type protease inhibitor [Kineosporia rhizophila]|uniref:SSI family serine proteinase inhibitor n=1 Tax=Kineosporia rhizophila TaxID=84633 RepID=UPI001E539DC2|nr:subtilase-type protease inhibitor [Kineosporia rhizophila]
MDHRSSRRPWLAPLSLCAVVALSACGSDSSDGTVTPQDAPTAESPATDLSIEVTDGRTTTWQLTCDPAGGDHPDAEAACAALESNGDKAVPTTPTDSVCTQIFGGEQTAVVTGTWQGKAVNATFSRQDGCEISRWDALTPLLPKITEPSAQ